MKLFGATGKPHDDGRQWVWSGVRWAAHAYQNSAAPRWDWNIQIVPGLTVHAVRLYSTAKGARDAMERTVKRLGIRVPGRGRP